MLKPKSAEDLRVTLNLGIIALLLRLIAVWPTNFDLYLPTFLRCRYHLSATLNALHLLFWVGIGLHIAIFHIVTVATISVSFEELFLVLVTGSIYTIMVILVVYMRLYMKDTLALLDFMRQHFRQRSAPGIYYNSIRSCYRYANNCFTVWIITCILGTMHWAVYPILSREKTLPFPCWYPVDVQNSPMYELAYIAQVLGQLQVGLIYGLSGSLFMINIFMTCSQFDILCCSLENVRNTAMLRNGGYRVRLQELQQHHGYEPKRYFLQEMFEEDLESTAETSTEVARSKLVSRNNFCSELSGELNDALDHCIHHHVVLLKFCRLLEECYNPYALLKLFQILLLLCFLAVMATIESLSTMKLINVLEYFGLTMVELYLFCFLGQLLQNQGLNVGDALSKAHWEQCGYPFRRRMLVVLLNAQKPIRLTAGKLYELNFDTYWSVLKAAFSYYTILKKFRQSEN